MAKIRRALIASLIISSLAPWLAKPAGAASFMYTARRKVLKVGVLTLSAAPCANRNPYIFFVMDQRADLKPPGWEFVNPAAPARANSTVCECHCPPGTTHLNPLFEGQAIYKNMSAYWEVPLRSTSLATLMQFDLLYLSLPQSSWTNPALDAVDAEKLRKYVDGGGQLWLDGNPDITNWPMGTPFFVPFPTIEATDGGSAQVVNRHHPIISYPYWLTDYDLNYLGPEGASGMYISADPAWFIPVVMNSAEGMPVVAFCEYGSGHVIVTSGDVGYGIAHKVTDDILALDVGPRLVSAANPVCLKFGYNVTSWSGVYSTFHRDARHSGRSSDPLDAPMVEKWYSNAGSGRTTPAFLKGVFFVSCNDGYVRAFDADPGSDLDMDGNPDDGLQDAGNPGGCDLIWKFSTGESGLSSPTVATVPTADGSREVVFVLGKSGTLYEIPAFPMDGGRLSGTINSSMVVTYSAGLPTADTPPAPTYYGGWVYIAVKDGSTGVIYAFSVVPDKGELHKARFPDYPKTQSSDSPPPALMEWRFPSETNAAYKPGEIVGSPSVGFVKDETGEALDFMLYFTCKGISGMGGLTLSGRIFGLLLAVRNERLRPAATTATATSVLFESRPGIPSVVGEGKSSCWSNQGEWITYQCRTSDGHTLTVEVPNANSVGRYWVQGVSRETAAYLDYLIDPKSFTFRPITQLDTPSVFSPTGMPTTADVESTPALGDDDIAYYGVVRSSGSGGSGGHVYAFREGGPTRDQIKWQYYLNSNVNSNVFKDYWEIPAGQDVPAVQVASTPAVGDKVVYVTGKGGAGVLMAFDANPEFCWYTDFSIDNNKPMGIKQIDWLSDPTGSLPPVTTSARIGNFDTFSEGKVVLKNFYSLTLTPSADVTLTYWSPDGVLHEETHYAFPNRRGVPTSEGRPAVNDKWNNLLWYYIPRHPDGAGGYTRCTGISASPTVIGDYVYFVCDDGYLIAVEAKPHLADSDLPKNGQIWDDAPPLNPAALATYKSHVKWMECLNKTDTGECKPAGGAEGQWAVAGAGGYLGVVTPDAFIVFDNPATLVADSNRVLEVDGGGNVLWMCEGTIERGVAGGALAVGGTGVPTAQRKSFNHPTALKRIGTGDYICADTGNNRVVRFDRGGTTTLEISSFVDPLRKLDPGDPLTLNSPTDVFTWIDGEADPITGTSAVIQHYLIVDKGNFRILDLGLRLASEDNQEKGVRAGQPLDPPAYVVLWASRTHNLGKQYAFQTAQIAPDPLNWSRQYVLASISNYSVGGTVVLSNIPERIGSSIVLLNYRTLSTSSALAWDYGNGLFPDPDTVPTDYNVGRDGDYVISDADNVPISGLTYFARFYSKGAFTDVICDAAGVHVRYPNNTWRHLLNTPSGSMPPYPDLLRKIQGYEMAPTGVPLQATGAKLLGNGHLLISNAYSGNDKWGNDFHGEVIEVDLQATGDEKIVKWYAPRLELNERTGELEYVLGGTSVLAEPGFVDR